MLSFPVSCIVAGDVCERGGRREKEANSCMIIRDLLHFIYFISPYLEASPPKRINNYGILGRGISVPWRKTHWGGGVSVCI